ncbi:hypothetical protein KO02_08535 [Sphingobacterium sp. ML3W]|nr:hypothetical protein KO02_08535 [Sphingobacterium sp. ML3W]
MISSFNASVITGLLSPLLAASIVHICSVTKPHVGVVVTKVYEFGCDGFVPVYENKGITLKFCNNEVYYGGQF